jgi:hypothetical protein
VGCVNKLNDAIFHNNILQILQQKINLKINMMKFICILLLAVIFTNAQQDIPWAGNYTVLTVSNINGTDPSQCCAPSSLNILRDDTDPKLIIIEFDFDAGIAQCDPTLIDVITIQQPETFGRVYLDEQSTTLPGAMVVYLLNNDTILLQLQDGCQIHYGDDTATGNAENLNYVERYEGIWVVQSFWSSDENECCRSLQPIAMALDDFTKTEAWIDVYPDDPVCPEEVRFTVTAYNHSVDGFGAVFEDYSEFMLANGSAITLHAPPYCNVLYEVKKPTMSTNLCDYVNQTAGNNTDNETDEESSTGGEADGTGGADGETAPDVTEPEGGV